MCQTIKAAHAGLRYRGTVAGQLYKSRKPRSFFVISDIGTQIKQILEKKGTWNHILQAKARIHQTEIDKNYMFLQILLMASVTEN